MSELLERLGRSLASRYRIDRLLGTGGMAKVFLAQDLKHDRLVAIKVLRPEIATAVGAERFLHEIRITAALDHPHILPLLDSGDADGLLYYVMPYVEGESLRDRLERERRLSLEDALHITREVADALDYAHERGVVHRDIKPENVLLAGRHARVADFGVARALLAAGAERLTESGLSLGTPLYMSPEVAAGEEAGPRSDTYALGCMLYEMLVGEPPYLGTTAQAVMSKHVTHAIPSPASLRPGLPVNLDRAIRRALAKGPEDRFPTAGAFVSALEAVGRPERRGRRVLAVGVGLMVVAAAAVGIGVLLRGSRGGTEERVAVLPRAVGSGDTADYLAEGLAEAVGLELMRQPGVVVIAHESARRLERDDPRAAARDLDVGHLVLLSAQRDQQRILVTVRLVDARGAQVWGDRYERHLQAADLVRVEQDIAGNVARQLGGLLVRRPTGAEQVPPSDFAAYEHYMRGRFFWKRRGGDNLVRAAEELEAAVALDPGFARGYVALAQTYLLFPVYRVTGMTATAAMERADALVTQGLSLDSSLGDAHAARGLLLELWRHDWPGARREFDRAIALSPDVATTQQWYGEHLLVARDTNAALAALRRAVELDPLSPASSNALAIGLHVAGQDSAAIAQVRRTIAVDSSFTDAYLVAAAAFLRMRRPDSVAASLVRAGLPPSVVETILPALSRRRPDTDAVGAVASVVDHIAPAAAAALYAGMGAENEALLVIEAGVRTPGTDLTLLLAPLPIFAEVARTARYRAVLSTVGLTGGQAHAR
jgi:eukaryotic-like serine/threonine-protein kinase